MSDIKVRDLVRVAFCTVCCGNTHRLGEFFVVSKIKRINRIFQCNWCSATFRSHVCISGEGNKGFHSERLVKVPPLAELEGKADDVAVPVPGRVMA